MSGAHQGHSCLYVGRVRHRRMQPTPHAFEFPLFMAYLDLSELDVVFRGRLLWSTTRPAVARFRRKDYLGPAHVPLDEAVRERVRAATGQRPDGPIRLLTHLRYCGYVFNPVSFYYCFDAAGERLRWVVAEITNTPWKERHAYVVGPGVDGVDVLASPAGTLRVRFGKSFHVSPFMPMELGYQWTFTSPGEGLAVHMDLLGDASGKGNGRVGSSERAEEIESGGSAVPKAFDATLTLRRRPMSAGAMAGVLVRYPMMTLRVIGRIHFEALRLWLKRVPVFPHPRRSVGAGRAG